MANTFVLVGLAAVGNARQISWWWDAPQAASDPAVDALLSFSARHMDIVSSIFLRCGPTTKSGTIEGQLYPACQRAIPALVKLGVKAELWLGETDDLDAARKLLDYANLDTVVEALVALQKEQPGISGFNFDLEVPSVTICGSQRCDVLYAHFLSNVRAALQRTPGLAPRVTVDAACHSGEGWSPVISNCSLLAAASDRALNMGSYNGGSYRGWLQALAPALAAGVDRSRMGAGLGCYVDAATNNTWATTPESAAQRVCVLMNASFGEIDMFRLAPEQGWPQQWWIPPLKRYMAGGGCDPDPPPPQSHCPTDHGWIHCVGSSCIRDGCCTLTVSSLGSQPTQITGKLHAPHQ
jgi:hypothetical protein